MYEQLFSKAQETDADIVSCDFYLDYDGKNESSVERERAFQSKKENVNAILTGDLECFLWMKLIKKSFISKNNLVFPNLTLWEDEEFTLKAYYYAEKVCYIPNPLYHYFQNENSIVHSPDKNKLNDLVTCISHIEEFLSSKEDFSEYTYSLNFIKNRAKSLIWVLNLKEAKEFYSLYPEAVPYIFKTPMINFRVKLYMALTSKKLYVLAGIYRMAIAVMKKCKDFIKRKK